MTVKPVVVIVDVGPTSRHLLPLFAERGYECVPVRGAGDGGARELLDEVAAREPVAVLAGAGSGVRTADALSEALALRTNGTRLSAARSDRARMAETARAAGLRTDPGDDDRGPGGTYLVNTVSLDGLHHVCDIWRTRHLRAEGGRERLRGARLLPRRGPEQDTLTDHAFTVLDALGVRNGPAHTELRLDAAGPCLVGCSPTVCGADLPLLTKQATGESQLDWTVDAYVAPEWLRLRAGRDYVISAAVTESGAFRYGASYTRSLTGCQGEPGRDVAEKCPYHGERSSLNP